MHSMLMNFGIIKAFLNLYIDESSVSQMRRRSTTEDDNPPSPVGIDHFDSFMAPQTTTGFTD